MDLVAFARYRTYLLSLFYTQYSIVFKNLGVVLELVEPAAQRRKLIPIVR